MILGLVLGAVLLFMVTRQRVMAQQAWPALRRVAARLQTDEGARDL